MTKNNMQKALPLLVKADKILCWGRNGDPNTPWWNCSNLVWNDQINAHNKTIEFEFVDSVPIVTIKSKTVANYTRLLAQVAVLKEIAMDYPGKTIENIVVQLEARLKEVNNAN